MIAVWVPADMLRVRSEISGAAEALIKLRVQVRKLEYQAAWWELPLTKTLTEIVTATDIVRTKLGEAGAILDDLMRMKEEDDVVGQGSVQGVHPGPPEDQGQLHRDQEPEDEQDLLQAE